jgi:HUS1 checkpoint protein
MAVNKKESDFDIQDAFDSLLVSEDNLVAKACEEGLLQGEIVGFQEGFDLGRQKGSEIGSEIFFYRGFAKSWIALLSGDLSEAFKQLLELCPVSLNCDVLHEIYQIELKNKTEEADSKSLKALTKLLTLLERFPQENPKNQDIVSLLQDIRAKFKHCCAILKVDASYSGNNQLNF